MRAQAPAKGATMPDEETATPANDAQPVTVDEQVSEWKPPGSQEELDRIISDRLARATKKYKDYDTLKEQAGRLSALEHELSSETDKAAAKARSEALAAASEKFIPRVVRAEFRANANGLTAEQLDALLEDVDLNRYVDEDGEPDLDRIKRKIAAVTPPPQERTFPDLGAGRRGSTPSSIDMNALIRAASGR